MAVKTLLGLQRYRQAKELAEKEDSSHLLAFLAGVAHARRESFLARIVSKVFPIGPEEIAIRDTMMERMVYPSVHLNNTPKKVYLDRKIEEALTCYALPL